jgi:hypothetical protein
LVLTGTFYGQSWTFYEKRPRFNAKWVNSVEITTSGTACSVIGRSANTTGAVDDIVASGNGQVLQRNGDSIEFSDDCVLGVGHRTGTSTPGSIDIAISNDGDSVRISDTDDGIAIFDSSISTTTPLIKISLGHASLSSTGRALSVREVYVCNDSTGAVGKMLIIGSEAY